jgi:hypothetical protein
MKLCPVCNSTFTDDSLRFCLQDGTALVAANPSTGSGADSLPTLVSGSMPTLDISTGRESDSEPTLILPGGGQHQSEPTLVLPGSQNPSLPTAIAQPAVPTVGQRRNSTQPTYQQKPRNLALVVVLTMLATLIVAAFLVGGYWFLFGRDSGSTSGTTGSPNLNGNDRTPGERATPTPVKSQTPNSNSTPVATPTSVPVDETAIRDDVTSVLNGWVSAARARDASANIAYYTDTLNPYYNHANYPSSNVRDERARVYSMYQTIDIELTNIKVTPDATGRNATATFVKTWSFENASKFTSGSVLSQMWFVKDGSQWLISGEKDLKVFYLNR